MAVEIDTELSRRLTAIAGEASLSGGVALPSSAAEVAAMVAVLADMRHPMAVHSGPLDEAAGAGMPISLSRLTGIAVDRPNLVVRAEAGVTIADLRAAVDREGQAVVGLPGSTDAQRVGALIARGEVPRRALTGIELVLSTGELVVSGGRVLKDVAGYDLAAAMLGSMGRLALIVAATFRLQPAGARVAAGAPGGARHTGGSAAAVAFDPGSLLR
ncbi:MAG: FAD-binding oxidoreductase [Candidatus Dormibacteria bacterium]